MMKGTHLRRKRARRRRGGGLREHFEQSVVVNSSPADPSSGLGRYYFREAPRAAHFWGAGAKALNLDFYDGEAFDLLLDGLDPTTREPLVKRRTVDPMVGIDLNFNAPKSLSILWGVTKDQDLRAALEAAHDRAVREVLAHIEREYETVSRGRTELVKGKVTANREPAGLVAAVFRHGTSRAGDPDLHSHAVLIAAGLRADGKWRALCGTELLQDQKILGAHYRAALAKELMGLGLEVARDGECIRLAGDHAPSAALCQHFSKRRLEVLKEMKAQGASGWRAAQAATHKTRADKPAEPVPDATMFTEWARQAAEFDYEPASPRPGRAVERIEPEGDAAVLWHLTERVAHFEIRDLRYALAVDRVGLGLDAAAIEAAARALAASSEVVPLGNGRFSTRDMLAAEARLFELADQLAARADHAVERKHLNKAERDFLAARRFDPSAEQLAVAQACITGPDLQLVQGPPGAGKSTLAELIRRAAEAAGYRVLGTSLSGKAAEGLSKSAGIDCRTIDRLILEAQPWTDAWGGEQPAARPIERGDIILIDEAGIIGTRKLLQLLELAQAAGAKVLLVGDRTQLQPIEAGGAFAALQKRHSCHRLTEIYRARSQAAKTVFSAAVAGKFHEVLRSLHRAGRFVIEENREAALAGTVERFLAHFEPGRTDSATIITNTRADAEDCNLMARARLRQMKVLGQEEVLVRTLTSAGVVDLPFAVGDQVRFRRNDEALGVRNGMLGVVAGIQAEGPNGTPILRVRLDNRDIAIDTFSYGALSHGYALTTASSQGTTVDYAVALAGGGMARSNGTPQIVA